ncbi:MAG: M23 family metallopeptidase [Corynebacterium sp.]|nr:M23 family metallopeptidase [Corynebacterium sp.]
MQELRTNSGKHRKHTTSSLKRSVTYVTVAATAVSGSAGAGFATAKATESSNIQLAANEVENVETSTSPQILEISEFKPTTDLGAQVQKAVAHSDTLAELDRIARTPIIKAIKPAEGSFTSGFGSRWGTMHAGIDIANVMNTPIYSVLDGVVIDAGAASGFGQWIRVKHEDGTITVYGHIETIMVSVGQAVKAGEQIAGMGSRGFSTGCHLHFEVYPQGGAAVDPVGWLAEQGISL